MIRIKVICIIAYMQKIDVKNAIKLGEKVKQLRQQSGLSLNSFVMKNSDTTTATWSRLENGKNDIKLSSLLRVAAALNISVCELLKNIDFDYNFDEY